jgi:MFS family permease
VVNGSSATESGYQLLPLLGGLILSSIVSGQIVSRTGRYKWLTVGALSLLAGALLLLTSLRADTPPQVLWVWQFIAGVGIGPTMAIFTIVVQNAVPWQKLGVATSNLTFFRQVGGTVGLALAGTIFGTTIQSEAPRQVAASLVAAGVPPDQVQQVAGQLNPSSFTLDDLSAVGDMGGRILAGVPEQFRALVEPLIPAIVGGIHQAFSLAIANTMWLGVVAALVALGSTLFLHEAPLRSTVRAHAPQSRPTTGAVTAAD